MSGSVADPSIYPAASSIGPDDEILVAKAQGIGQEPELYSVTPAVLAAYLATIIGTVQGVQGPAGVPGAPGSQIYSLEAAPLNSFGNNGDYYLNTVTGVMYGPKSAGVWPGSGFSFGGTGPAGPAGPAGPQGPAGAAGTNANLAALPSAATAAVTDDVAVIVAGVPSQVLTPKVLQIYPENFGAQGNGTTDDTAAINAYITWVKSLHANANNTYITFQFKPNSVYLISGPLNFGFTFTTGNNSTITILGNGATITGTTGGKPMLDCINTGYGSSIKNLHIYASSAGTATCGILYGYSQPSAGGGYGWSDQFILESVTVLGYFAYSCVFNRGADTSSANDCEWLNFISTGAGIDINDSGFALIDDSAGVWGITSAITSLSALPNNGTGNKYINCTLQSFNGPPIWICTPNGHQFIECYASTNVALPICIFYLTQGNTESYNFRFQVHCEGALLTNIFYLYAPYATSGAVVHLQTKAWFFEDSGAECLNSIFKTSTYLTYIQIQHLELIVGFSTTTATVFDTPSVYTATGRIISFMAAGQWNAPGQFVGEFFGSGGSAFTFGAGVVDFYDYSAGTKASYGTGHVSIASQLNVPAIGATTPGTGAFTTLSTTGAASLGANSTAVTPAAGDNSTKIATTAFVAAAAGTGGGSVTAETARAEAAETALSASILAETTRAEAAEAAAQATANAALPNTISAFGTAFLAFLNSLPTAPGAAPGWWNNSGTPAYS